MKRHAYFLVILTFWAQLDDVLLPLASASQSTSLASDDEDECLPSKRKDEEELFSVRRQPHAANLITPAGDVVFIPRDVPSDCNVTTLFTPPPLYVFMSLQI
jgi:hypothetical protein